MAIGFIPLPYGLRDVKLYPLGAGDVPGTSVDLPNSKTFQFTESESFTDLRGDDALVATHGQGPEVAWTIDGGGVALEIIKTVYGGTITETGVTPNQVKTYTKSIYNTRPYFQAIGQAISDSGGDFHIVVYKCKATGELSGSMADGQFFSPSMKGKGLGNASGLLWSFVQDESVVALT